MKAEGVVFETGVDVGADVSAEYLRRKFDAVCITAGARVPRDLTVPGRDLDGIHFAMDVPGRSRTAAMPATPSTRSRGDPGRGQRRGGHRRRRHRGRLRRHRPPPGRARRSRRSNFCPSRRPRGRSTTPGPPGRTILRTSSSHEEGCTRMWSIQTKEFYGRGTRVAGMKCVKMEWSRAGRQRAAARPSRSPARSSNSRPASCCWPSGSCTSSTGRSSRNWA